MSKISMPLISTHFKEAKFAYSLSFVREQVTDSDNVFNHLHHLYFIPIRDRYIHSRTAHFGLSRIGPDS